MAMTPFQKPISLAVMWWSSRKRGNMVTAPCSPVDRREDENKAGRWEHTTQCVLNTASLTRQNSLFRIQLMCQTPPETHSHTQAHAYGNQSQTRGGFCTKLFSLQDGATRFFSPRRQVHRQTRREERAAHLGLFLESVNNRWLTRKRIPSVALSNGGLALFLKHKKENTTKTQKLLRMKQTSQRPFSQNKKVSVRQ